MRRRLGPLALAWLAFAGAAAAQGIQNSDMFFSAGVTSVPERSVANGVALPARTGWSLNTSYGYQVARRAAVGLWLEMLLATGGTSFLTASDGGSVFTRYWVYAPGLRVSVPAHQRVSLHGAAGAGAGSFYGPPFLSGNARQAVTNNITWHGVVHLGGGVDFRLNRRLSLRAELRDFITGRGLSGVDGRHHRMELFGIGLHF